MKELLEKFLWLFSQGVEKLQEEKSQEAIEKFAEASKMTEDLLKKSETPTEEVSLAKLLESDEWKESLKKYVDLYISDSTLSDLIEQIKEATATIAELKKEKEKDDEIVSKTLDNVLDRIEKVEQTAVSSIED